MFATVDGGSSGYMAFTPDIPAPCHVLPPSILGNDLVIHLQNRSGRPASAEALARMDGCFPEWMAKTPSTLR